MELHETIYQLRTAREMSQQELAEALDVSRQSISKWETGAAVPELDKLVRLSDVFGITLDELVRGEVRTGEPVAEEKTEPQATVIIERRGMEGHRLAALVVLCTGLVLTLLLMLLGDTRTGLTLGAPVVAAGALFLALPRRHLLWGFWALWLLAAVGLYILTGGWLISFALGNTAGAVISLPMLAALIALIVATVRRLKKQ